MGFDLSFKCPTCLATLKSCDTTNQSFCGLQYIYIYIYIYICEIVSILFVFEVQTNELSGLFSLFMLLNFSESKVFAGEVLVLAEISFFYSLVWILDIFSLLSLKIFIFFIKDNIQTNNSYWLTNYRWFRIIPPLFDKSANQMLWSTSVGRISLSRIRF